MKREEGEKKRERRRETEKWKRNDEDEQLAIKLLIAKRGIFSLELYLFQESN